MTSKGTVGGPIDIGTVAQPPFVRLPDLTVLFARRAARLDVLSRGHPMADYLKFVAALVRAQAAVIHRLPAGTLPGPDQIDFLHEHKLPLVDRLTWRRDARFGVDGRLGVSEIGGRTSACIAECCHGAGESQHRFRVRHAVDCRP